MSRVVVQYRTRSDAADENQELIERVFAALAEKEPGGLRYQTMRLEDEEAGTGFLHVAEVATDDGSNPLTATEAFAEFQAGLPDRTVEAPLPRKAEVIGSYGF